MRLVKQLSVLAIASVLPLTACGGSDGDGNEVCDPAAMQTYTYVVDSLQLPTTPNQALDLALDLDGAMPLRPDNTLGMVIATLADQANLDVTAAVSGAVNAGDVILLASLETESLATTNCATMGVFLGADPSTPPCTDPADTVCGHHLDGATAFSIAPASPLDTKLDGQVIGGKFSLGPNDMAGNFTIEIDIAALGQPLALDLIGARIEANVTENGINGGLIGGAITKDDLDTSIMPAIHGVIEEVVTADCAGGVAPNCCTPGSAGEQVLSIFDADDSCTVTLEELQTNSLISALLAPDLDLLDAAGNYAPNSDGIADSLSIGLGFGAVHGEFQVP